MSFLINFSYTSIFMSIDRNSCKYCIDEYLMYVHMPSAATTATSWNISLLSYYRLIVDSFSLASVIVSRILPTWYGTRLVRNAVIMVKSKPKRASFHRLRVKRKNFLYTGHENFFFYFYFFFYIFLLVILVYEPFFYASALA